MLHIVVVPTAGRPHGLQASWQLQPSHHETQRQAGLWASAAAWHGSRTTHAPPLPSSFSYQDFDPFRAHPNHLRTLLHLKVNVCFVSEESTFLACKDCVGHLWGPSFYLPSGIQCELLSGNASLKAEIWTSKKYLGTGHSKRDSDGGQSQGDRKQSHPWSCEWLRKSARSMLQTRAPRSSGKFRLYPKGCRQ